MKIPTNLDDWQAPSQINIRCTSGVQPFKRMPVFAEEPLPPEGAAPLAQRTLAALRSALW